MSNVADKELLQAQFLALDGVLSAPDEFKTASLAKLKEFCNGCGAQDSWFRPPKRIYGTLIIYACIIHDWEYSFGLLIEDKWRADRTFHNNINRLITKDSHKWYKPTRLQRIRAKVYYEAVVQGGGEAFWCGKHNRPRRV